MENQNTNVGTQSQEKYITLSCPGCEAGYDIEIRNENNQQIYRHNGENIMDGELINCIGCDRGLEVVLRRGIMRLDETAEEEEDWGE